ncbi:MAG: HTH-type transcriptional regulator PrtR [Paracidovorax wautersii]|uniref:HTH-type transcriptional regulator PrtR n=1 Tax=Paracidovorax wautersii TaxID=1177982 RepID=A0A7V8FM04_9BURK|nr:MAG: HTH-type transcriptional regulator PrtR [Paracidovorax wautersii]
MIDFQERLAKAMEVAGVKTADLAKAIGVSYQAIKRLEEGKAKSFSSANNSKAADALGVSARWLATGEGPMRDTAERSNVERGPADIRPPRPIPVVGAVKAGDDGYLERLDYPVGQGEGFVLYWAADERAYALRVKGDSMHPRYRAGEFVIVTPSIEAAPGRDVVVSLKNGKKLLKQLNWVNGGSLGGEVQLLSINNGYAPMTIDRSDIESIQRVAGSVPPDAFMPN